MVGFHWDKDKIYLLKKRDIFDHFLLKGPKGKIWSSYHTTKDGKFKIYNLDLIFNDENSAKNFCEYQAKMEVMKKIQELKELLK